jgi:hypothetical protein
MGDWIPDELNKIGAADELQIAALRPDGTLRPFTTIWVVRVGDDLYVRSYRGRGSPGSAQSCSAPRAEFGQAASLGTSLLPNPRPQTMTRSTRRTGASTGTTATPTSTR